MDFASLMTKEISKAKTSASPKTSSPIAATTTADPSSEKNKKYVRRADLEAARIAAYNEEQEKFRKEREERATLKRQIEEDETAKRREMGEKKRRLAEESKKRREAEEEEREIGRRKRLGLPELPPRNEDTPSGADDDEDNLDDDELIIRLRERGEPARLFGESHRARLRRYRRLMQPSQQPLKLSQGPIPTTLELLPEAEMKVSRTVPREKEARRYLFRQLASYFTMVLEEWAIALARRDQTVKQSFQGRAAYNAMVQSRENMRPLFRRFEQEDLNDSVLEAIVEIVHCAQERRYVDANDGYLRLSIGKA
jgi:pre-mRNA-splicing factor 18